MRTGVEAKRPRWTKIVSVLTVPHERIGDENVRVCVTYAVNWVFAGRCSELEFSEVRADKNVSVVGTATAIVNAKRIADWDITTSGSAETCLRCSKADQKWNNGNENERALRLPIL